MNKEITSTQNSIVKHLVRLRQNRDYREEHQSVLVEGIKMIGEICKHHQAKKILAYDEHLVPRGIKSDEVYIVNEAVMKKLTGTQSPEGLVAEVAMPKQASLAKMQYVIACDGISDPGNLGTLLRSALALGWEGVFILSNSCDPYNDKALRAAKGATFRMPIAYGHWSDLKKIISQNKLQPLAADIKGANIELMKVKNGALLVMGNEAHGLSEEAASICERITIPMSGKMESLNVGAAGAILMYMLGRKGK